MPPPLNSFLLSLSAAATQGDGSDAGETQYVKLMLWSGLLVLLILVGYVLVMRLKRKLQAPDDSPTAATGFTLSDLRQLYKNGQMTEEEFEKAKAKVVEAAKRAEARRERPGNAADKPGRLF